MCGIALCLSGVKIEGHLAAKADLVVPSPHNKVGFYELITRIWVVLVEASWIADLKLDVLVFFFSQN